MLPSLDELCKGYGSNIKRTLERCKEMRRLHRLAYKGFTKKRLARFESQIPVEFYINPQSPFKQYFSIEMDRHERGKNLRAFLRKYPEFLVVDKMV